MTLRADISGMPVDRTPFYIAAISRRVEEEAGLLLPPSRYPMIEARLKRRLARLDLGSYRDYLRLIDGPDGATERATLLGLLTTHVSHFFREPHHFQMMRDRLLPPLIAEAQAGRKLRFWSAGGAAGQEAYSLALTLLDLVPNAALLNIEILATDLDAAQTARAARAHYPTAALAEIPPPFRQHCLPSSGGFTLSDSVRGLVRCRTQNLHADWQAEPPFHAILCRNVLIYFEPKARERLISRFAGALTNGGWLLLGHADRMTGPAAAHLNALGQTVYCKGDGGPG
ncbi:chemotaxis protein [Frigidibacter sp. RF13]|uniref:CheR family methyltransferase n=1 Tax=Frigidibacter sp. RF13 TaxID=2997340 RepID=UPI00226DD22A|nr:CheR family methyltransferase [Frigidibacter sp. RF13]MCY1125363.1 chemotaxis protein [Frigidibacter sp. RF13]